MKIKEKRNSICGGMKRDMTDQIEKWMKEAEVKATEKA